MPASPSKIPPATQFDPWSGQRYGGLRWLAVSSTVHAGVIFLLATVTLTVLRNAEPVRVRVVGETNSAAPSDWEGDPSLRDLAGVLKMEHTAPQRAAPGGPVIQGVRAPEVPRISGVGPQLGAGPVAELSPQLSFGAGAVGGLGGNFGDYVGGLRKVGLDVVLVIDTTDSMQFVIDDVRQTLSRFVGTLQRMVPTSRVGVVAYRDKGDEYVVKWTDLSFHTAKLQEFLSHLNAAGGGDWEEAVKEGLDAAVHELKWRRQSKKIIILCAGSPPHPWDVNDVNRIAREFRASGGSISALDVIRKQHEEYDRKFWRSVHGDEPYQPSPIGEWYDTLVASLTDIVHNGGGEVITAQADQTLMRAVLQETFGQRWTVEMAQYLKELF